MNEKIKKKRRLDFSDIKSEHEKIWKKNFFDVQIHCQLTIFPGHRYILSSSSELLAEQLASGVDKLNWNEFEERTGTALLRWIYTNEVGFDPIHDVTVADQWLDLLYGSYKLQLVTLFTICEETLLSLSIDGDALPRFNDIAKKVGAYKLIGKYLDLKLNVIAGVAGSTEELDVEIDEISTDHYCSTSSNSSEEEYDYEYLDEEFEELLKLNKLTFGYHAFRQFSNVEVITHSDRWQAHAHILESRSKKFREVFTKTTGRNHSMYFTYYGMELFRWLYTDCVVFDDKHHATVDLLKAAQFYELPTLFERCEQAIVERVDITSCAYFHKIAEKQNAATVLKCCNQLISKYFIKSQSLCRTEMDVEVEMEVDNSNSLDEMMVCDLPTEEAVEGLLTLNDDCLLHVFRFVSLVDLGSIKGTCKRFSSLADQSFRLYREKSLEIESSSMFASIWILKHFGNFIKSLSLESFYERYASRDDISKMIARFTDGQLKSISLNEFDKTDGETFECLKTVLKNVDCIELMWFSYDSNIDTILNYCENLKEVNIDGQEIKLKSDWCSKNPNITKFTMSGLRDDKILEIICKELTRLEYLSVDCIDTETDKIIHLSRLSSTLKKLRIGTSSLGIGQMLQQFADKTVLKDLTLQYTRMTESLANVLGDFPNLSNLVFENRVEFNENVQDILSKKLVRIESLAFVECEEITFNTIAKIVKNLLDLKKLSVNDCDEIDFIDKSEYLSLRKIKNLQIFLDQTVYERSCESIGNNWLDNVQVKRLE
ncbi:uncharacterized protein LOC119073458 isoform X2 [Bradysia coprophila]|uniref:uncharacterized protein LOC119073458 isoform X2 n=1 Tax=Bradysia coprophila TaxID=38358 RepID=UPI00187DBFC5|nr:uncharacterized protein LOC119073458 isoform X2 [Bradysia coprophila]